MVQILRVYAAAIILYCNLNNRSERPPLDTIGNHDSLMAKHGIYYDMFEKQQLEAIHGEAGKALIRQDHPAAKTGKEDA